jgi:hypothetical protein
MEIVYECNFGMERYGKIEVVSYCKYQCYETPLFGGDWISVGNEFDNLDDAIEFLESLT